MRHLSAVCLLVGLWLGLGGFPASIAPEPGPEGPTILDRALERAQWSREQDIEARFRHVKSERKRTFNEDGEITHEETRVYAVAPYQGVPYAKLVTKNGAPIGGADLVAEHQRWERFLEEVDDPAAEIDEDELEVTFNKELVARYSATLSDIREWRGRPSYVFEFQPKPGKLPVRRRIDRALNRSRGQIWIDQATHEVAHVNFELIDRVRIGWGVLGSISQATGHFTRTPIADNAWLSTELEVHFEARVLFRTTRRSDLTEWREFRPVPD